ncbi:efflux RND transporter periplasmic adaptor subunit [Flavihumibacter stibioxidans]|uniref:Efflux transporter periplasmic adaptor subunit n=1 Tax=Flavihumibacter stibioxidans TaxID=1834163 RepID=A0ABR7MAZ0_9BACT|nr:efflux RND transporter periplasmic adaptor subunit [Flavihumibacter stibioxidans]MBC6492181.1 efflux transporter periplasmic adaptor subunit [Flavihumibacter stibioxidans]
MKNFLIIAGIISAFASCTSGTETKEEAATEQPAAESVQMTKDQLTSAGIETGKPTIADISKELQVNGVVDVPPQNIVSVSFPLGGYLKSTKLLPGMHVSKGEVIGVIEDQSLVQLQQDYLIAQSKLVYLQQEYDRQQLLSENKVSAEKVFQQVKSDFQSQQVLLKGFAEKLMLIGINPANLNDKNLSRSVAVRSPINGYVSKVNVNIGKYVNPTDVLFELINPDDMHAALTVFEKDINKVRIGQKVEMKFVDDPSKMYEGDVLIFTRNVDENRSGVVHCHFDKMPKNLMPGMFLSAIIKLDKASAVTVPDEAIVRYGGKQYVFEAIGDNQFGMVEVEVDTAANGLLAISSKSVDLAAKQLVLKNAYAVLGKMKNTAEE